MCAFSLGSNTKLAYSDTVDALTSRNSNEHCTGTAKHAAGRNSYTNQLNRR